MLFFGVMRFFTSLFAALLLALPARAEEPPRFDVGAKLGLLHSTAYFVPVGFLAGVDAHYHLDPALRVGAYVQAVTISSTSSDHKDYEGESFSATRFGVEGELHALPDGTLDPWLGLALGGFSGKQDAGISGRPAASGVGLDFAGTLGLDVNLGAHFALGAAFAVMVPLTHSDIVGGDGSAGKGTYYSGLSVPLPLLRARVSF